MTSPAARSGVLARAREVATALTFELVYAASLVVIFPITAQGLGPDRYGEYTTMYVIAGFALTWVHAGGAGAIVQLILQRERKAGPTLRLGWRQVALASLPIGVAGLVVTWLVLDGGLWAYALIILVSDLLVLGLSEMNLAVVFSRLGIGPTVRIRILGPILRVIGVVTLSLIDGITLLNLLLVNSSASLCLLAVSWMRVRGLLVAEPGGPESSPDNSSPGELARLSALYSASMSTNAVQQEGEKVLLAGFRPISEVGEYQAAYRVVSAALIPLRAVHAAAARWFLPKDERIGSQVHKAWLLTVPSTLYGVACGIGLVLLSPVVDWVVGEEFALAGTIAIWLCAVPLLHALAEIPPLGLLGLGQNRVRMYLGGGAAAVALVGYAVLIPTMGWRGAVVGTYVSESVTIAAGWWLLIRYQHRLDQARRAGSSTVVIDLDPA